MGKKLFFLSLIFFSYFFLFVNPKQIYAQDCKWEFKSNGKVLETTDFSKSIKQVDYSVKIPDAEKTPDASYIVRVCAPLGYCSEAPKKITVSSGKIEGSFSVKFESSGSQEINYQDHIEVVLADNQNVFACSRYTFTWTEAPTPTPSQRADCKLTLNPPFDIFLPTPLSVIGTITNLVNIKNYELVGMGILPYTESGGQIFNSTDPKIDISGKKSGTFYADVSGNMFTAKLGNGWAAGDYNATAQIYLKDLDTAALIPVSCSATFTLPNGMPTPTPRPKLCYGNEAQLAQADNDCSGDFINCPWCDKVRSTTPTKRPEIPIPNLKPLCDQLNADFRGKCWECQKKGEIWSAIGCLPTNFSDLINKYVFTTGVGIAGGIAFLYFLYGAFLILTSSGNAEKMEEARQIITSALLGLFLIIFSIFLLRTIGVDILQLPGFK